VFGSECKFWVLGLVLGHGLDLADVIARCLSEAMALETERKFLVNSEAWRRMGDAVPYAQGYLSRGSGRTVRVRIAGQEAFLTIKGPVIGITRQEFEYPIPVGDARSMLALCDGPVIEKTRTTIAIGSHVWEVDEFAGDNAGLIVAEVELNHPSEHVEKPEWVGSEVTGDPRYYNSNLTVHPYKEWRVQT
jgi:CYTH domain-containing protein